MFKNRSKLILLLLPVALLLTGCWDSREVEDLSLATMVILDRQGDELSFTVEIAKIAPAGENGGGGTKQTYLTGAGKNLAEARDALDMQMDKPLFLGTVRTLVITERAAANDLAEYLFRLRENQEYRQKVSITVSDEDPKVFTEFKNENDEPAGFVIDDTILTAIELGHTEKQFNEIQEQEGDSWYNKKVHLDRIDNYDVFTFTHSTRFDENPPSEKYLNVIKEGIKELKDLIITP